MRLVMKVFVGMLVAITVGGSVFAQDANFADLASKTRTEVRTMSGRGSVASQIKAENLAAYYAGVGFEDAKQAFYAGKTEVALDAMYYLSRDLKGIPESTQVETAWYTLATKKDAALAIKELEAAQTSFEKRINAEQRWYYNAGKNYVHMIAYLRAQNYTGFMSTLAEYGQLGKTAPAGAPAYLIAAFVTLGEVSSKTPLTESDVAIVGKQLDIIDGLTNG